MKSVVTSLFIIVALSGAVWAAPVTITFNSTGSANYLGEVSYSYYGTVNGAPTTFMCINDNRYVSYGETWLANPVKPTTYEEDAAAWLFLRAGDGSNSDYQGAVWWLFNNSTTLTSGASALLASLPSNPDPGNVIFYVPDQNGSSTWTNGQPQTFMAASPTPEPSTLILLGSATLALGGALRRKLV